jgi:hypothetical protein
VDISEKLLGKSRIKNQNTLFSLLGMLTYTYERQDIIQIALKRLPEGGGGSALKKKVCQI